MSALFGHFKSTGVSKRALYHYREKLNPDMTVRHLHMV